MMPNKTDAGNGSKAICRVSNVLRSPSPDPKRSVKEMEDDPPRQLVDQRVRNRLIELWELHASPEGQRRYQDAAPVNVFYELFEQWDDWVPEGNVRDHFGPPVFSGDEIQVMESYDSLVDDMWEAMPKTIDSIDTFCGTPQAATLQHEAEKALLVFKKRGSFDEEHLVNFNSEQDIRRVSFEQLQKNTW